MTRQKSEIKQELSTALTSATWNKIKTALLGKELLSFGTEVIYQGEQLAEQIVAALYVEGASYRELVSMAGVHGCSIDMCKPSTVKVELVEPVDEVVPPFSIKVKSGSVVFTNIEFVNLNSAITLYQGTIGMAKNYESDETLYSIESDYTDVWDIYSEYTESENYSRYLKLGHQAMSESVRVFTKEEDVPYAFPLGRHNIFKEDPDANIYKVQTGHDGSVNIIFGNGIWGKSIDDSTNQYQAFWLNMTHEVFSESSMSMTVGTTTYPINVLSSTEGGSYDLAYSKEYLKANTTANTVVATAFQIRNYTNAHPLVLDSEVVVTGTNEVTVYVKPVTEGDEYFDDIADNLALYGEIVTTYKVQAGTPFTFNVHVSPLQTMTTIEKNSVTSIISSEMAYDKLAYVADISSVFLNEIATRNGYNVTVRLNISEFMVDGSLTMIPVKGSINIYDNGALVGWDSVGNMYALEPSAAFDNPTIGIGDFLIDPLQNSAYATFNDTMSDTTAVFGDLSTSTPIMGDGFIGLVSEVTVDGVDYYHIRSYSEEDNSYTDTEESIQRLPSVLKAPIHSVHLKKSDSNLHLSAPYSGDYIDSTGALYSWEESEESSGNIELVRYVSQIQESGLYEYIRIYYPVPLTVSSLESGQRLVHIFTVDSNMFIVTNTGEFFTIVDYKTVPVVIKMTPTGTGLDSLSGCTSVRRRGNYIAWIIDEQVYVSTLPTVVADTSTVMFATPFKNIPIKYGIPQLITNIVGGNVWVNADYYEEETFVESASVQLSITGEDEVTRTSSAIVNQVVSVGSVDYTGKLITTVNSYITGKTVTYDSSNSTLSAGTSKYPKLGEILWE